MAVMGWTSCDGKSPMIICVLGHERTDDSETWSGHLADLVFVLSSMNTFMIWPRQSSITIVNNFL
jgi:hypothetical protein